jgi:hypothetical protein
MTLDGGEVTVGHVLVKVGDYPMLRKGRQYVLGVLVDEAHTVLLSSLFAVDSTGEVIREVTWSYQPTAPASHLYGRTTDAMARELARLPRR